MAVPDALSVTVIVGVNEPKAVGVPRIMPLAELRLRRAGKLPVMEYVSGGVPPLVPTPKLNGTPSAAVRLSPLVMASGAGAMDRSRVPHWAIRGGLALSDRFTVTLEFPHWVGVPLMTPVVALIERPLGSPLAEYV